MNKDSNNVNNKLQDFYEKFKSFETKDGEMNFEEDNTNFNFSDWIDDLRDDLFKDDFKLAKEVLKITDNTPYNEFKYAYGYVIKVIKNLTDHFNWDDTVYPNETSFYALQNLSSFIFSLLNRLTMIRHVLANEDYLGKLTTELAAKGFKGEELGMQIRDKLKRVTFNNWRYNPLLKEYQNCFLWAKYLKEARNVNEHYGVLFKTGDPNKFDDTPFSFYADIILESYLFLYYVKFYVLKLAKAVLIDKKEF